MKEYRQYLINDGVNLQVVDTTGTAMMARTFLDRAKSGVIKPGDPQEQTAVGKKSLGSNCFFRQHLDHRLRLNEQDADFEKIQMYLNHAVLILSLRIDSRPLLSQKTESF